MTDNLNSSSPERVPGEERRKAKSPMKCEFCYHYPSYTAAAGVACQRCVRVGVGDVRSDSRPPVPRENLAAQEELLSIVPRYGGPYSLPDMVMVERILAVFGYNVCEVQ